MIETTQAIADLLQRDNRYRFESYIFVFEALQHAQENLGRGCVDFDDEGDEVDDDEVDRHVSGQELCEAIRRYALQQFGMLSPCVFSHWGIRRTGDYGEIVYNLIDIGQLRKTDGDRREDFEDVFDITSDFQDRSVFRKPSSGTGEPIR